MDFNRNQFFFLGMFVLLIGIQVRLVESYVLTPEATQFLAKRSSNVQLASTSSSPAQALASAPVAMGYRKTVRPPEWLGWCLLSIGAVLILHSLAMPRPT